MDRSLGQKHRLHRLGSGDQRRNLGLRIDLTLVSDALKADVVAAGIDRIPRTWERASDHTPAWVELAAG